VSQPYPAVDVLAHPGGRAWGRFADRPRSARPAAEFAGIRARFEDWRTKEWVGFTLIHPEVFSSMIVQEAKYLASSELYVIDAATRELVEAVGSMRGGTTDLPDDLLHGGEVRFRDPKKGYRLEYDFDEANGRHEIRIDIAATASGPGISGALALDAASASAPLAVSFPLGGAATMFTYKRILPASGSIAIGARRIDFDPARDFAIIDEHRSHLPYWHARWTWGTFAFRSPEGEILGANFADRPQARGSEEESALWVPGLAAPLADVTFTPASTDPLAPVAIRSADGRLEAAFTPRNRKRSKHQFVVASIDYFQMVGTYSGTIRDEDREWSFEDVHGVCESMAMRS